MKPKIARFLLAVSLMFFYSCKKDNNSIPQTTKPSTGDSTGLDDSLMLQLVNNIRKTGCKCGTTDMPAVNPLTWNTTLAKVAFDHSKDMNTNNYFSHTDLDGSSPGDRITAAGYSWSSYGENIAYNFPDEVSVMNAWLQSEGHCKNIMGASFTEMGSGRSGAYWTQDFGSH